jgi:hypothetical protein
MNQLLDLINRYAAPAGYHVNPREWLMLLELDQDTAARTINHLAILAAEDDALRIASLGHAALAAAHTHLSDSGDGDESSESSESSPAPAPAALTRLTARMTSASDRAWTAWHQIFIPLLSDACVLTDTAPIPAPAPVAGRRWADTHLHLAGLDDGYPGQIAVRRQHLTAPIVRFTLDVCRRIADDIHAHDPHHHLRLPPVVLLDADQPVLVAGADDLDAAWRGNATILLPDPDGWWPLGSRQWPWHADAAAATAEPRRAVRRHTATRAATPRHASMPTVAT